MASPAATSTELDTLLYHTLDLAPVIDDENDGDMSGLTRKFLLAFSHCTFYLILNPFFTFRLHVFRRSQCSVALRIPLSLSTIAISS